MCVGRKEAKPRLISSADLVRFADDAVLLLKNGSDAERVMEVRPKRFQRFGLELRPDKNCTTEFKPRNKVSIDFLGFTHYGGRNRGGNGDRRLVSMPTVATRFLFSLVAR